MSANQDVEVDKVIQVLDTRELALENSKPQRLSKLKYSYCWGKKICKVGVCCLELSTDLQNILRAEIFGGGGGVGGKAHQKHPKAHINTYFSFRAKWWLRGGAVGQFPKNLNWSKFFAVADFQFALCNNGRSNQ